MQCVRVIEVCAEAGVEVLTLFAFSSENWQRPAEEVSALMELFLSALRRERKKLTTINQFDFHPGRRLRTSLVGSVGILRLDQIFTLSGPSGSSIPDHSLRWRAPYQ